MKTRFKKVTSFVLSAIMAGGMSSILTNAAPTTLDLTEGKTISSSTINGYTTGGGTTYAIDIYFDPAPVYCYNKGTYNTDDGKYYATKAIADYPEFNKSFSGEAGSEKMDVTAIGGGAWFDFDGTQNLITVVNKSNADVDCTVSHTENGTHVGAAIISVYEEISASESWYTSVGLTEFSTGTTPWASTDFNAGGAFETKLVDAAGDYTTGGAKQARAANPFGTNHSPTALTSETPVTMAAAGAIPDVKALYYSISGAPAEGLLKESAGESIGTITLTFTAPQV